MSTFLLGAVVGVLRGLSHSISMKSLQDKYQDRPCITDEQTSAEETDLGSVGTNGTAGSLMLEPPQHVQHCSLWGPIYSTFTSAPMLGENSEQAECASPPPPSLVA